jgi:hypothetical protein
MQIVRQVSQWSASCGTANSILTIVHFLACVIEIKLIAATGFNLKSEKIWDVFLSHASEDKSLVARPLANKLAEAGLRVWLDEAELHVGDRLREKVDEGLSKSRFGVLIVSTHFFSNEWARSELDALMSKEYGGNKVILPVWHELSFEDVQRCSPILASRLGVSTEKGLTFVAQEIVNAIHSVSNRNRREQPIFAGSMTKKQLLSLPTGCVLVANGVNSDFSPVLAAEVGPPDAREGVWAQLRNVGYAGKRCYVFGNWAGYRAHFSSRSICTPALADLKS